MRTVTRIATAVGIAFLLVAPAAPASAAPSEQDTTFLRAAHQSNLAEIAGGQLAQQKGQSQQVKELGARFVADHTRLDEGLRQTAGALGVSLPEAPNAEQQAVAARYRAAQGTEFDAVFIATQMDAHMKAMRNGEKELAEGSDAQAKKVAQDSAPVIASHHDGLSSAARALGLPASVDTGSGGAADRRPVAAAVVLVVGLLLVAVAAGYLSRPRAVLR